MGLINSGLKNWPPYVESLREAKNDLANLAIAFDHLDKKNYDTDEVRAYFPLALEKKSLGDEDHITQYIFAIGKENLIARAKEFLEYLHKFAGVMKPIVAESLGSEDKYLHRFFDADEKKFHTYFQDTLTNFEEVKAACLETKTLVEDILESLTKETFLAYIKWVKDGKKTPDTDTTQK